MDFALLEFGAAAGGGGGAAPLPGSIRGRCSICDRDVYDTQPRRKVPGTSLYQHEACVVEVAAPAREHEDERDERYSLICEHCGHDNSYVDPERKMYFQMGVKKCMGCRGYPRTPLPPALLRRHVVIVLGCGKPDENEGFKMAGSSLEKRVDAGASALLSLRALQRPAKLILSGGYGEARCMAGRVRQKLAEAGVSPQQAAELLLLEDKSRSTVENAFLCRDIAPFGAEPLHAVEGLNVWVVSTMGHLPRAVMLFQGALPRATVAALPSSGGGKRPELRQIKADADNLAKRHGCIVHDKHRREAAALFGRLDIARVDPPTDCPAATGWFKLVTKGWTKETRSTAGYSLYLGGSAAIVSPVPPAEDPGIVTRRACVSPSGHPICSVHRVRCGAGVQEPQGRWALLQSDEAGWFWLVNQWLPHLRVHTEYGEVLATDGTPNGWSSAKWRVVDAGAGGKFKRLENKWKGKDQGGGKGKGKGKEAAGHGMTTKRVVHVQHVAQPTHACFGLAECEAVPQGWSSAQWTIEP